MVVAIGISPNVELAENAGLGKFVVYLYIYIYLSNVWIFAKFEMFVLMKFH